MKKDERGGQFLRLFEESLTPRLTGKNCEAFLSVLNLQLGWCA